MRDHDMDLDPIARAPDVAPPRREDHADLASKALAQRNVAALGHPSVVHLQATAGNASVSRLLSDEEGPSRVKDVVGSGTGERLDPTTAKSMEHRFGEDFSDVRIHRDEKASESAKAVNAQAYTVGSDIVFQSGRYSPNSESGNRMLAHELTHVVQQRAGPVAGRPVGGGLRVSDPADAFEQHAEHTADRMSAASAGQPSAAPSSAGAQREIEHAEEPAAAQRQAAPEEEEEEEGAMQAQREAAAGEEEEEEEGAMQAQRQAAPGEEEEEEEPVSA